MQKTMPSRNNSGRLTFFAAQQNVSHMTILETARLRIRELRDDDLYGVFLLQSDPAVMRYIRPADTNPAVVRDRLVHWAEYHARHPKLGVFAMEIRDTESFAGYCTARHMDFEAGRALEIGYVLMPRFADQGLATEVASALTDYLFREMQAEKIVAVTDPNNTVSQRVLDRCGFQQAGIIGIYGANCLLFERLRDQERPIVL